MIRKYFLYFGTVLIVIGLTMTIFINFIIPSKLDELEKEIIIEYSLSEKPKKEVFICISEVISSTILTENNFLEYFDKVEVDLEINPELSISNENFVFEKILNRDFTKGQILTEYDLSDMQYEELTYREMEFFIEDDMMGKLNKGDLVDLIVDYENGNYDIVLAKKKVIDIVEDIKIGGFYIFLAVNEKEYSDMIMAKTLGRIETRKYFHENQKTCFPTFKGDF